MIKASRGKKKRAALKTIQREDSIIAQFNAVIGDRLIDTLLVKDFVPALSGYKNAGSYEMRQRAQSTAFRIMDRSAVASSTRTR